MNAIHTEQVGNYTINIYSDDSPESPREWDNLGTMVCFHKRYHVPNESKLKSEDYSNWSEIEKALTKQKAIILPVYMYDHSGVTLSTAPFSCPWDSGQLGFIYVTNAKVREEYSVKKISPELRNKVAEYLQGEVETYSQYLNGDVYGYEVIDEHGEEIGSCWGFYGLETAIEAAKEEIPGK